MDKPLADQRSGIIRRLVALGEKSHQVDEALRLRGFAAFVPYQRFIESFALSSADLDIHRQWVVENAKAHMGSCDRLLGLAYRSELLERLFDEAAHSPLARDPTTRWIAQNFSDPCEQAALLFKLNNRAEYEKRETAMRSSGEERRASEIQPHCELVIARHSFSMLTESGRFGFAAEVLRSATKDLGFEATKRKPSSGLPIVAKQLTDTWRISWCIGDPGTFMAGVQDGMLVLHPVLEAAVVGSPISFAIPLHSLVHGLWFSYGGFSSLETLEINVLANLELYRLVQFEVETAVQSSAG